MKRTFSFLFALMLTMGLQAAPVTKNAAFQTASSFMKQVMPYALLMESTVQRAPVENGTEGQMYYYVFNAADDNGFVIVSGDDRTESVLGYSTEGHFDPDNLPDGLAILLERYTQEIQALDTPNAIEQDEETGGPMHSMSIARKSISPMVDYYYYSNAPYYNKTPMIPKPDDVAEEDYNPTHTTVGCVNVAIAQLLAYWQYPDVVADLPAYTTRTYEFEMPEMPAAPIQWDKIAKTYHLVTTTAEQKEVIADFMLRVGVAMQADYTSETSTNADNMFTALPSYFGFEDCIKKAIVQTTGVNKIEDIIYNELSEQRPVLLLGTRYNVDPAGTTGHLFVVDGYDCDDWFHINWGWNTHMNGYYRITAISPYHHVMEWNYMNNLTLYYDLKPAGTPGNSDLNPDYYTKRLQATALSTSSSPRAITIALKNDLSQEFTFSQGMAIYSNDDELLEIVEGDELTLGPQEADTITYALSFAQYANGAYKVKPVSKLAGTVQWRDDEIGGVYAYVSTLVSNKVPFYTLIKGLQLNSIEMLNHGDVVVGRPQEFKLNLTNNTSDKNSKLLSLYVNDQVVQIRGIHIPANCSADLIMAYEPKEEGPTTLLFSTGPSYVQRLATYNIDVLPAVNYNCNITTTIDVEALSGNTKPAQGINGMDTLYVWGNTFRAKVTITNNGPEDYHDIYNFILREDIQHNTEKGIIDIPAGESLVFEYEYSPLVTYRTYRFTCYTRKSSTGGIVADKEVRFTPEYRSGFRYWTADGKEHHIQKAANVVLQTPEDAVAIACSNNTIQPSQIYGNSNPNTLYYITGPYYAHLDDEGRNTVRYKNGQSALTTTPTAANLTITDGYPFFIPIPFNATDVNYTRNFDKGFGNEGTNWSTIVLPFVPQTIKDASTNKQIDWYHTSNEVGKDFWIREFYAEDGNDLYFTNVKDFEAYRPYIIAVPDASFGSEFDLTNRDLVFHAENIYMEEGPHPIANAYHYSFEGTLRGKSTEGLYAYILNEGDGGNIFTFTEEPTELAPNRAMFTSTFQPNNVGGPLRIIGYTSDIKTVTDKQGSTVRFIPGVYTIDGRKLNVTGENVPDMLQQLPKGIYIIQGCKYVK